MRGAQVWGFLSTTRAIAQTEAQLMLFMNVSRKSMTYALRPLRM